MSRCPRPRQPSGRSRRQESSAPNAVVKLCPASNSAAVAVPAWSLIVPGAGLLLSRRQDSAAAAASG